MVSDQSWSPFLAKLEALERMADDPRVNELDLRDAVRDLLEGVRDAVDGLAFYADAHRWQSRPVGGAWVVGEAIDGGERARRALRWG